MPVDYKHPPRLIDVGWIVVRPIRKLGSAYVSGIASQELLYVRLKLPPDCNRYPLQSGSRIANNAIIRMHARPLLGEEKSFDDPGYDSIESSQIHIANKSRHKNP